MNERIQLTKEEFDAVNSLYSYYCSLGNLYDNEEEKESTKQEQAIKRSLNKLIRHCEVDF